MKSLESICLDVLKEAQRQKLESIRRAVLKEARRLAQEQPLESLCFELWLELDEFAEWLSIAVAGIKSGASAYENHSLFDLRDDRAANFGDLPADLSLPSLVRKFVADDDDAYSFFEAVIFKRFRGEALPINHIHDMLSAFDDFIGTYITEVHAERAYRHIMEDAAEDRAKRRAGR